MGIFDARRGGVLPRLRGGLLAVALTAGLVGCGGDPSSPPESVPSQPPQSSQASPSPAMSPDTGAQTPGQTDPLKLDAALLKPEQLPGWEAGEPVGAYTEATIEPQACKAFHQATLEKVASDMGSTVAYQQGDKSVQEYLDLVDRGTDTLANLEQQLSQCGEYTVGGEGVKEPVKVEKVDAPKLGDKALAVKMVSNLDAQVENQIAWVAQGDVVLMVRLEGDQLDPATLPEIVTKAHQQMQGTL